MGPFTHRVIGRALGRLDEIEQGLVLRPSRDHLGVNAMFAEFLTPAPEYPGTGRVQGLDFGQVGPDVTDPFRHAIPCQRVKLQRIGHGPTPTRPDRQHIAVLPGLDPTNPITRLVSQFGHSTSVV